MLNINYGHNQDVLNACKRLHDYSYFNNEVEMNLQTGYTLEEAINHAIDTCIEKDILRDILEKQKSEVVSMLLTEYDKKLHDKTLKDEGIEEGIIIGEKRGEKRGANEIVQVVKRLRNGESEASLLSEGISQDIINLAKSIK